MLENPRFSASKNYVFAVANPSNPQKPMVFVVHEMHSMQKNFVFRLAKSEILPTFHSTSKNHRFFGSYEMQAFTKIQRILGDLQTLQTFVFVCRYY